MASLAFRYWRFIIIRMIKNWLLLCATLASVACDSHDPSEDSSFQGVVELEQHDLAFRVSGRVDAVHVHEGQRITVDALLVELDDELARSARDARRSDARVAEASAGLVHAGSRREDVRATRARLAGAGAKEALAKKTLARERKLVAAGASTKASLDAAEANWNLARSERSAVEQQLRALERGARPQEEQTADARVEAALAAVTLEQKRVEQHVLSSPVGGSVLDVHVEVGEFVAPGTPVVSVAEPARPYVEIFVPQEDLAGIHVGNEARVRTDSHPNPLPGRIEWISPRTEFTPRYLFSKRERPNLVVRVRVRIDDRSEALHAGVPAFVDVERTRD